MEARVRSLSEITLSDLAAAREITRALSEITLSDLAAARRVRRSRRTTTTMTR
jgi:hypothetical protein